MNAKHGTPATLVCTARHDQGQRWQARWVGDGQERSKSFAKKTAAEAYVPIWEQLGELLAAYPAGPPVDQLGPS